LFDKLSITQTGRCKAKLVPKTFALPSKDMPYMYSDTAADVDFADSGDLFKNVDPEPLSFCQIDTC